MLKVLRYYRLFIAKTLLIVMSLNAFSSVIFAAAAEEQKTRGVYDELALLHLPSLATIDVQEKHEAAEFSKKNKALAAEQQKTFTLFKKSKAQKLKDVQDQDLKSVEALRLVYNSFQETNTEGLDSSSTYLQKNVCNDLTMFYGDKVEPMHHLFSFLDNTETIAGRIQLQKMLYEPTSDINELTRRQNVVKALLNDQALADELTAKVQVIKDVEKQVLWFCRQHDETIADYYDVPYIQNGLLKQYNGNETTLEVVNRQRTVMSPTLAVIWPLIIHAIYWKLVKRNMNRGNLNPDFRQNLVNTLFGGDDNLGYGSFLKQTGKGIKFLISGIFLGKATFMGDEVYWDSGARIGAFIGIAVPTYMYYKGITQSFEIARINNKITSQIQEKLIAAATLSNTVRDLGLQVYQNNVLKSGMNSVENLKSIFDGSSVKKPGLSDLLHNLSAPTFAGKPSFFSLNGKVLNTFNKIQKEIPNLIDLMKFAGQVDAYLSIAKVYKKLAANENAQYCFVDYISATTPSIDLVDFWHPMLDPNKVVKNSAALSGQDSMAQNMIVTGPNAGGKSTALKAITIAVVLAQTIGIVPAGKMSMTPFALINTYLNVTDTIGRESLFQAELNRAKKLINSITSLNYDQFSFVILDEIFTGTNPEEGKEGSRQVINLLNKQKNNIAIIATHFHDLTDLEEKTRGHIKNYKVSVARDNGAIKYLYKLEPGISEQKIALELVGQALSGYNTTL